MARKTTLDRLAQMVQRGFAENASKLQQFREEFGERFKDVHQRFDSLLPVTKLRPARVVGEHPDCFVGTRRFSFPN